MTPRLREVLNRWYDLYNRQPQDPWDREDIRDEFEQVQEELAEAIKQKDKR